MKLNEDVREYWEERPCGTLEDIVGNLPEHTTEWFERVEDYRIERNWPGRPGRSRHIKREADLRTFYTLQKE